MTNEELKEAFLSEQPVESNGIAYKCVSAIIYRKSKSGGIKVTAELLDKNRNSVSIVLPNRITGITAINE